jgi:hypothetical protein
VTTPPYVRSGELDAYRKTTDSLMEWAPTVHELVLERIRALEPFAPNIYRTGDPDTETAWDYTCRALAEHQRPIPVAESLYDGDDGGSLYEHVEVHSDRIIFTGQYPVFDREADGYRIALAEIFCPTWLISREGGVEAFRAETANMVERARLAREASKAETAALVDKLRSRALQNRAPATLDNEGSV